MLTPLLFVALVGQVESKPLKIVDASLFKNGYAVIMREIPLDADGETIVTDVGRPSVGTLWFTASSGVSLQSITATTETTSVEVGVGSVAEILRLNAGKSVTLTLNDTTKVSGVLTSVVGDLVRIQANDGNLYFSIGEVKRAEIAGQVVEKRKETRSQKVLKIKSKGAGKAFVMGVEPGFSWQPAYAVDISNEKQLKLTAKATLINDLADVNNQNLKLVTGFPNLPNLGEIDPLIADQMMVAASPRAGGGFGGGMSMNQMARGADQRANFDEAFEGTTMEGLQADELFMYQLASITLAKGERSYQILFSLESAYEHVYRWDVNDAIMNQDRYIGIPSEPGDVWHSLVFKNTGKQPFTTGIATVINDGNIVGQDSLFYTSPGASSTLRINKAMDVRAEGAEEEIARERVQLDRNRNVYHDKLTIKGTLEISNRKGEPIKLEVSKAITGEVLSSSDDAKVTRTTRGLRAVNPSSQIVWSKPMKTGEKVTLSYTYTVYLPS